MDRNKKMEFVKKFNNNHHNKNSKPNPIYQQPNNQLAKNSTARNKQSNNDEEEEHEQRKMRNEKERLGRQRRRRRRFLKSVARRVRAERDRSARLRTRLHRALVEKRSLMGALGEAYERGETMRREWLGYREHKTREMHRIGGELEALRHEYMQVMSERDTMCKDMDALEEKVFKLEQINARLIKQHTQRQSTCSASK